MPMTCLPFSHMLDIILLLDLYFGVSAPHQTCVDFFLFLVCMFIIKLSRSVWSPWIAASLENVQPYSYKVHTVAHTW